MYKPRQRTSPITEDSGGGEGLSALQAPQVTGIIDPRDGATKQVTASVGGETLYDKNGRPLTLQQQTLDQFKTELNEINKIKGVDLSFKDYYNLPTRDKVYFSLQAKLGQSPSKEQVENAIKQAKSPTGLRGILSPITTLISGMLSSQAYSKDEVDIDTDFRDQQIKIETASTNLSKLIDPRTDSPYGTEVITADQYAKYKADTALQSGAMFPSTGKVGKLDDFLSGIRRDPRTGNPMIWSGKRKPDGTPIDKPLTADVLARLEKNRQKVAATALDRHLAEVENIRRSSDIQYQEERAGSGRTGDLATVEQNEAFNQQMREAEAIARGTPRSSSTGRSGGSSQQFGASNLGYGPSIGYGGDKTAGESFGPTGGFYVGGVATKPMKPQRLKKGGIASPKAKPKKMKKGGLASSRKK